MSAQGAYTARLFVTHIRVTFHFSFELLKDVSKVFWSFSKLVAQDLVHQRRGDSLVEGQLLSLRPTTVVTVQYAPWEAVAQLLPRSPSHFRW